MTFCTRVQAQALQPGDKVGSGETVIHITHDSYLMPKGKIRIGLKKDDKERWIYWNKHTIINVERN